MNGPFDDLIEELMFRKTLTIFELSSPGILYNNRWLCFIVFSNISFYS